MSDGVADAEVRARIEARAAYGTQHKARSARLGDDLSGSVVVVWSEQTARVLAQALGNDQHARTVAPTSPCYGRHTSGQEMRMFHNSASLRTAGAPVHSYSLLSREDAKPGAQSVAKHEGSGRHPPLPTGTSPMRKHLISWRERRRRLADLRLGRRSGKSTRRSARSSGRSLGPLKGSTIHSKAGGHISIHAVEVRGLS